MESTCDEAEEKSSLDPELSDQKSQRKLDQLSCNTKENSNVSPELRKIPLMMPHSLEHPGSPDCPSVLPCHGSQSLPAGTSDNNQNTAVAGAAAVSMAGAPGAPGTPGTVESQTRETSVKRVPVGGLGSPPGTQELPAGLPAHSAAPAAGSSSTTGQPPNPANSEGSENCATSAGCTSSQGNQNADAASSGQPPNFVNTEPSVDSGIETGHTPSQHSQETPAVSATTASASPGNVQNAEGAASENDGVNASLQPNASIGAFAQSDGDNSSQRPTGTPVQESEEDGDTSTDEQTAQQEETDNSYEQLLGE